MIRAQAEADARRDLSPDCMHSLVPFCLKLLSINYIRRAFLTAVGWPGRLVLPSCFCRPQGQLSENDQTKLARISHSQGWPSCCTSAAYGISRCSVDSQQHCVSVTGELP